MTIRPAAPADAEALAALQLRAWWRAYADYVDPERFGTLERRVTRWQEILAQPPGLGRSTLVFELAGALAGFAAVGPSRRPGAPAGEGELMALYVDPPAQGAGVGGALLDAAVERLATAGFTVAVLSVFEANAHARHVYERRGWTLEAGWRGEDAWAPDVRYRRPLTRTDPT